MKVSNKSHKLVASLLGLGSVMVFAGVVSDMRLHSDNFMDALKIESATETGRINTTRFVASSHDLQLPAVQYLPYNDMNMGLINGQWEIRRIVDANSEVIFDKIGHYEDKDKSIKVDFELVGTSTIMIDGDRSQVFKVSLLTEFGTIALFKVIGDGYEILEAKKVVINEPVVAAVEVQKKEKEVAKITGLRLDGNKDLVLERALHPSRTSQLLTGNSVRGNVSLIGGNIENLSIALYYEQGLREEYEIAFAEINDGGMFEAMIDEETVHGIITNNGEGVFRIRFATGRLQGAMLNFVTEDKLNEIAEDEYVRDEQAEEVETENYYTNTEVYDQSQAHQVQLDFENARKEMSQNQNEYDNYDSAFMTEEDRSKHAQAVGFEF